ncbi:MAG: SDR family oxidoreductase [Candidatus Staskawiczbacteria bacterium]|nr:SDR family oxidoreductase [Candidatus Staskawiczbacteria bacterium]
MELDIKNKYALVTGGSHGIGRAIALSLAREGCNVAICALDKEGIDSVVKEIELKGVKAVGIVCDVLKSEDIDKVMKEISDSFKTIDILINNVGGGGRWGSEIVEETKEEVWLDVYNKNAMTAVRFTMKAIPFMRKQKWGRVVTIASIHGLEGGGRPWFNMAKSAEISLMKTLSMNPELAKDGITFNSVAPGPIMIEGTGWEKAKEENSKEYQDVIKSIPSGRLGTPREVADVVVFLCSSKASLVSGSCIAVDGGESHKF